MKWAFHSSVRSLGWRSWGFEPCWMMNWGDFVWGIFLREMKWDVFFFQPLKAPKNTHKKWHDWKRMEFSFSKQMYSSLFLLPKTPQISRRWRGKTFPVCFFVSLFENWSWRIGFWMMISSGMFMMGCFFLKKKIWWGILVYLYVQSMYLWDFYGIFWCLWDVFISFPRSSIRFWCRWRQRTDIARQPYLF